MDNPDPAPDCPNCNAPMTFEGCGVDGTQYRCTSCPARCLDESQPAFRWMWKYTKKEGKIWSLL